MLRTRGTRFTVSALALAACATVAVPTAADAKPAPAPLSAVSIPMIPEGVPVDALASLIPAIVGAAAGPADIADAGPKNAILAQAKQLLETSNLPPQVKTTLLAVITFLDGSGGGGPDIPKDGPVISQFLWPTIGKGCISASADSVGTALAVAGPAQLPPPGPAQGQAGFVFTALGTKRPTDPQPVPMTVQWLNLDTRATGTMNLTDDAKINPDGPATLSAIANTGSGRVVAIVSGSLTTQSDPEAQPITCSFLPTIGFFTV
ncbi:Rv1157c family protein [Nocardia tengchongensis]|uniref:Rv1157c family protein n=1 Tax=Nocardia tengchongensis TaxID=2055889 RepID=UPI003404DBE7